MKDTTALKAPETDATPAQRPDPKDAKAPKDPKVRKLSDFLCFAIYSANLAFGRAYKPLLDELGLTYTQYVTIVSLWEEDDITVGDLGAKL
ncbi:MAG TPA: MarR family winged helix-turn-helix transcriptional regulator, partial [Dongiaceae bacterium]|nr:MarR family winged helix-turn-helix transcriptional regulator [Dongiaceae bacterium]